MNAYFSILLSFFFHADCGCANTDHYVIEITRTEFLVACPKHHLDIPAGEIVDFLDPRLTKANLTGFKINKADTLLYLRPKKVPALAAK